MLRCLFDRCRESGLGTLVVIGQQITLVTLCPRHGSLLWSTLSHGQLPEQARQQFAAESERMELV